MAMYNRIMKLNNKVALVTGSSRGIGKAIALLFGSEGAKVVINYSKSAKEAEEVVNKIKQNGGEAIAINCDISNEPEVKEMVDAVIKQFGGIDILVNNAGIVFDKRYTERTAGLVTLTKDFALELAPRVRVNAIAPGWVKTEMNKDLPEDYINSETERTWLKRFAEPEEIAKAALFLASDDSSFITGTILMVDGGYI